MPKTNPPKKPAMTIAVRRGLYDIAVALNQEHPYAPERKGDIARALEWIEALKGFKNE